MGWFSSLVGGVIGFFVGGPVGAAIGAGLGATRAGEKIVNTAIDLVVKPFMGMFGTPDIPGMNAETQRQQGVLITRKAGGAEAVPVIYGLRRVGGLITFAGTGPEQSQGKVDNKYLWVVYVFSEGEVSGLSELSIDDNPIDAKYIPLLNAGNEVNITDGKYANCVTMRWSPGVYFTTPTQSTLGTVLKTGFFSDAPKFTSRMSYNGLATLFVRYEWLYRDTEELQKSNPFAGGIPTITATILGRKVASLEPGAINITPLTEHGDTANGYTERYSTNPAEILLDYLRHPRYGKGMKNAEIDYYTWGIACSKFNAKVTYTANPKEVGPILTSNYVLDTNNTIFQNVKILLQGMRAYMPYVQGTYKLKIEDAGNPTNILSANATIVAECVSTNEIITWDTNDSLQLYEIQGDITYTGIDRSNKYNQVVVTYVDPDQKWSTQQMVFPEREEDRLALVALDGGRENKFEITLPTITNYCMASDFARIILYRSRYAESCTLTVSSHAFELEPGDCIRVQGRLLNFYEVPWRVVGIQYNENYTFTLSCIRNPDFIYPYVQAGERDYVLPIYVPKGIEIYYPTETPRKVGLLPPDTSNNGGAPGTILNPQPDDPPTDGGGVGGVDGDQSGKDPGDRGNINQPPVQDRPQPLTDVVDVTSVTYVTEGNLVYANLRFARPAHAMYGGVDVYYKFSQGNLGYAKISNTTVPAAGGEIVVKLGPLASVSSIDIASNYYEVKLRVKYLVNGQFEYSTGVNTIQINPRSDVSGVNPSESFSTVDSSWNLPVAQDSNARRDNNLDKDTFNIKVPSLYTAGQTRTLSMTLTQDARNEGFNYSIQKVIVYYKSSTNTSYWLNKTFILSSFIPGTPNTFTFDGDIGVGGGSTNYSFIFRFIYSDGKESTQQYVANARVEYPSSAGYTYPLIVSSGASPGTPAVTGITTGAMANTLFGIKRFEDLSEGSVPDSRNMTIGVAIVRPYLSPTSSLSTAWLFLLYAPDSTNIDNFAYGVKIRYRALVPGTSPAFSNENTVYPVSVVTGTSPPVLNDFYVNGMQMNVNYEVVITPMVRYAGETQEGNKSLFASGYINNNTSDPNYPRSDANNSWTTTTLKFSQQDTATVLKRSGQFVPNVDPVLSPSVARIVTAGFSNPISGGTLNGVFRIREYLNLQYDTSQVSNFVAMHIYRRTWQFNSGKGGTNAYPGAWYYGVGTWEQISKNTTGAVNINLRMPIDYDEYDYNSSKVAAGRAGANSQNKPSPYGTVPILSAPRFEYVQYLMVVETTGGRSARGILLQGQRDFGYGTVDLLSANPSYPSGEVVTMATDARMADTSFDAGYGRRISEAYDYRALWANSPVNPTPASFTTIVYRPRVTGNNGNAWNLINSSQYKLETSYPSVPSGTAIE